MPNEYIAGNCFVLINPRGLEQRRTFCVLGSPRGGTSMVAGLLRLLGVFMGERLDEDNNEDQDFIAHAGGKRNLFRQLEPDPERSLYRLAVVRFVRRFQKSRFEEEKSAILGKIRGVIEARNRTHSVWGWKDPISIFYVPEIANELVEPVYLVIYRDPLSITLGEYRKNGVDPLVALNMVSDTYMRMIRFIRGTRAPVLCISYEKALQNAGELVAELGRLTGTELDSAEIRRLSAYIEPNRNTGRIQMNSTGS